MYHSVTINGKNTWDDYHMIPANGIYLPTPPEQKRTTIDLKTGNGLLDVSTVLTGYPLYQNRSGELQYFILDPWDLEEQGIGGSLHTVSNPYDVYSQLLNDIHGTTGTMIFEDDPYWYYQGTFTVKSMETNSVRRGVVVGYEVAPYKMKTTTTSKSVSTTAADTFASLTISESEMGTMPINPTISVSGTFETETVTIQFCKLNGTVISTKTTGVALTNVTYPDVVLYKGGIVKIKTTGSNSKTLSITWRPGRL